MREADLYIRYSQSNLDTKFPARQEELLRAYCSRNDIGIRKIVVDIGQSSHFKSKAWREYLNFLRSVQVQNCSLLFTTWDRFSRNDFAISDMIQQLEKLGIIPKALNRGILDIQKLIQDAAKHTVRN